MAQIDEAELAALRSSGRFDAEYYSSAYQDVAETGLDPAFHFLWLGARLGRRPRAPRPFLRSFAADEKLDILFVDGTNATSSTPYRVDRVAAAVADRGARVRCVMADELGDLAAEDLRPRYVTFFRAPLMDRVAAFARRMRSVGARIVFDVDDLIFDEEQIPIIDGYKYLTDQEKVGYLRGVRAYREFVLFSDFCTAPTTYLAERMSLLGKKAFRVRNTIDRTEIEKFRHGNPRVERPEFVIGYYSGSKTHQADFRNAGEALVTFMQEQPNVRFRLVGDFDLGEYPTLEGWAGEGNAPRVVKRGVMDHSDMLEDQLACDVIIAPLEVGNPFCEAKSELKFFEASLARCPVIASPTQTFRAATLNGELAQLADTPRQWLEAFRASFRERRQCHEMAARAHRYAIEEYSPEAAGRDAVLAYSDTPGA